MFKRVLVPLDKSALSERVLPIAKGLARSFGSRIDLVNVVPTISEDIPEEFIVQVSEEAEAYLKGIQDALAAELGAGQIGHSVQRGYPASVIIEQAESQDDTLVLMSTHGYTGVQRLLLGRRRQESPGRPGRVQAAYRASRRFRARRVDPSLCHRAL